MSAGTAKSIKGKATRASVAKLRAWWWHRQGLDGSLSGSRPAEVLVRSGWARSVGGAGPYLAQFARGGVSRKQADAAAAKLEIHELPSARGCTYVLPAADFALGLLVAAGFDSEMSVALKLGVTEREIDKLCEAVLEALDGEPLDPDQIRAATGKATRSLGEAGKKKGLTTTLPVALGKLQVDGRIRRVPKNGRLDQQRYSYTRWEPSPLAKSKLTPEQARVELARRFFGWIGPASLAEFQWFSGLGVKACKAAVEPLPLEPVDDSGRLMLAADREAFERFEPPSKPGYALVSSIDSMLLLRRDLASLLDPDDLERQVLSEKSRVSLGSLADLPSHAVLDRGRIVGLWEYDPESSSIAWTAWVKDRALRDEVERTAEFVRDQLGDARAFSLDSPQSRAPRIAALRGA